MDPHRVREREAQCIQEQPPFCNAACPIQVDARGMIDRVRKGDFKGGLAVFARYVPFPAILARICDRPCQASCKRTEAGDPVRINALERACVDLGGSAPVRKRMAGVERRIAISGGGLSGLTAAVELAAKGYEVTVFEPGPRLLDEIRGLCEDAVAADLAVLASLEVLRPRRIRHIAL